MSQSQERRYPKAAGFALALLCLLSWSADADAGSRRRRKREKKTATATTLSIPDSEFVGSLEPTNIPILTPDMLAAVSETPAEAFLRVSEAHQIATGAGTVVAILDGGFTRPGVALQARLHPEPYDAVKRDGNPIDNGNGRDDDRDGIVDNALGHGTFVAGMVLSVAPDTTILPIRIADDEGRIKEQWMYDGIAYAKKMGADVINLSAEVGKLSEDTTRLLFHTALEGTLIVVAAGNGGTDGAMGQLAETGMTIAVGAVDLDCTVAPFSNFESNKAWWDYDRLVYAPGVDLMGSCGIPTRESVCIWSGTSFAAGLVSGAAALKLQQMPTLRFLVPYAIRKAVDPVCLASGEGLERTGVINLLKLLGAE